MTRIDLRAPLNTAQGAAPINRAQRLALYNPDPAVNSLAERVTALRRHGVPAAVIKELLADIATVLRLNEREGDHTRQACAQLEDLARLIDMQRVIEKPSIKKWVQQARPHLAVLREPHKHDAGAYVTADRTMRDLLAACPQRYLTAPTMSRQLGDGPYRQLLELAGVAGQNNPPEDGHAA